MKMKLLFLATLALAPGMVQAAESGGSSTVVQAKRLTEADRKVMAGRILLKWGGYVEKVNGQNRRDWSAAMWPSLASADLDNLQKASRAVTYEGMRNALLGQRPYDDQVIDRMARTKAGGVSTKALGSTVGDLVFTPLTPCRIADTRTLNDRIAAGAIRNLDASNPGEEFSGQGGSNTDCGIPANPAALALSVTALNNTSLGFVRVYPSDGFSTQGSPVSVNSLNSNVTNDIIVRACQGCIQELKVYSTATTHYAVFVTGYFSAPEATALECISTSDERTGIAAGDIFDFPIPACPAGYARTGAGCRTPGFSDADWAINGLYTAGINGAQGAYCSGRNKTAGTISVQGTAACCRVPGR